MFVTLFRRLKSSVKKRGVFKTLVLAVKAFFYVLNFANLRAIYRKSREDREFDRQFGLDTGGTIPIGGLDVGGESAEFGRPYVATSPKAFKKIMECIKVKHEDFAFVDFGSGKGRVLLLASEWPFKRIVGVEFSQELHEIAKNNILNYRSPTQRCRQLESVCMDAAAFPIPDEPAVCYLFNPFQEQVMSAVLANIQKSWEGHPRDIYVLYHNPIEENLLSRAGFLRKVNSAEDFIIYKSEE